jgi:hypothetical protein
MQWVRAYKNDSLANIARDGLCHDEIIRLADEFVHNFIDFMLENGIRLKEHTSLKELTV